MIRSGLDPPRWLDVPLSVSIVVVAPHSCRLGKNGRGLRTIALRPQIRPYGNLDVQRRERDREVRTLGHFEELGNPETAQVLGISQSGASSRNNRAVMRLKKELASLPGFLDP
jgi:hypothetical protein